MITLTFSKTMALLVLLVGSIFAFYTKNSEVLIFSISIAGGLSGLKSWSDGLSQRTQMKYTTPTELHTEPHTEPLPDDPVKNDPSKDD